MLGNKTLAKYSAVSMGELLPKRIFVSDYERHLFFDADIRSSREFIESLRRLVAVCYIENFDVDVFSSSMLNFIGSIKYASDWVDELSKIHKQNIVDDAGGFILQDGNRRWVAYQRYPSGFGVFAFNSTRDIGGITELKDSFFDANDVFNWLQKNNSHDADLVKSFGEDFLYELLENYN